MNKKDDLLNLIEELDQYLYTKNDVLDDVKWDKHDLLNHADAILKKYDLCYGSTSFHLNVNDNTFSESPYIMDLNTGKIIAQYEHNADTYDRLCDTDESKMKLVALHKLLTNYMDYFYKNVDEFNIDKTIKAISTAFMDNHLDENKGTNFILNEFDKYDKLCRDNNIAVKYYIKNNNIKKYYEIYAEYSNDMYDLQSSVRVVNYLEQPIKLNQVALIKLACLEDILKMIRLNTIA